MYEIVLAWKEHNIDMRAFDVWVKTLDATFSTSADSAARVYCLEEPSDEIKQEIADKWASLDDAEDPMCESYRSDAQMRADREAAKASAKAKLAALGLSDDEVAALVG